MARLLAVVDLPSPWPGEDLLRVVQAGVALLADDRQADAEHQPGHQRGGQHQRARGADGFLFDPGGVDRPHVQRARDQRVDVYLGHAAVDEVQLLLNLLHLGLGGAVFQRGGAEVQRLIALRLHRRAKVPGLLLGGG
jgi:hypothetical protein